MPGITKLPCEIINAVLRHVGSLQNLSSALLSCRHVHTSFFENPHVAVDILQRQIDPALLPYAVAVMEASRLDPRTAPAIQALLHKLNGELHTESQESPTRTLVSQLATLPFPLLSQMSHTHDGIHSLVTTFSSSAGTHLSPQQGDSVSLSPKEYVRFCRAFYRMKSYFRLFRRPNTTVDEDRGGPSFLRTLPAWENEQIGCAQDFLELQFSKASRDVTAHDVFFSEMTMDYLTPGFMNFQRQRWLAKGISFVNQLITETSYDVKYDLLEATYTGDETDLNEALVEIYGDDEDDDDVALKDYSDGKGEALFQPSEPQQDADRGPFDAWWTASKEMPLGGSLMLRSNAGFRERAYVLWDEERLKQYNLLELFTENAPESELELEYSPDKRVAMAESFRARSEIYQKGGSGYWSKDDESRIVWSK